MFVVSSSFIRIFIRKLYIIVMQLFVYHRCSWIFAGLHKRYCHNVSGKVISVRKKISPHSMQVMESKSAASALKHLNWENNKLFGRVISSKKAKEKNSASTKNNTSKSPKINFKNNASKSPKINFEPNIQICTKNTVDEIVECSPRNSDSAGDSCSKLDEVCASVKLNNSEKVLNTILEFPLLNNSSVESKLNSEVNELRQHLQTLSSSIPSVTTILDRTMPPEQAAALERWKKRMTEEMGEEKFAAYQKETLETGSSFHSTMNSFLCGVPEKELVIPASNAGHWKSVQNVLPKISTVRLLEEHVTHPFLCYKGVVDCFAQYRNDFVVVEWKSSKKLKLSLKSTYDNPLQLAAYIGALNFDPRFQYMVDKGLLVIAYEAGHPSHTYFLQKEILHKYWTEWLKRLKKYWES